jgi:glycosyltransferase involved in cell wall biosynthesis
MNLQTKTDAVSADSVSVCIATYNQAAYLVETIQSVLAQSCPVAEIIVSDDASTDATPEVCRKFAETVPNFRYFRQEQNLGMGANVEFVLRKAQFPYVVRLDSDDRLLPDFLKHLLPVLQQYPEAGYAHGNVWQIDENGLRQFERILYRSPGFQPAREALVASLKGYRVAANIVLFRRAALEKTEIMKGHGDYAGDYHLAVGLARAGYGNVYVGEMVGEYRVWSDAKGARSNRLHEILHGMVRVFDEQIEPGFREAGLPLESIRKARRSRAVGSVLVLDRTFESPAEKQRFKDMLFEMGDSGRLRLLVLLIDLHLGFVVRGYRKLIDFGRFMAKKALRLAKRN